MLAFCCGKRKRQDHRSEQKQKKSKGEVVEQKPSINSVQLYELLKTHISVHTDFDGLLTRADIFEMQWDGWDDKARFAMQKELRDWKEKTIRSYFRELETVHLNDNVVSLVLGYWDERIPHYRSTKQARNHNWGYINQVARMMGDDSWWTRNELLFWFTKNRNRLLRDRDELHDPDSDPYRWQTQTLAVWDTAINNMDAVLECRHFDLMQA